VADAPPIVEPVTFGRDALSSERERGISVSAAVTTFEYQGRAFKLLDPFRHQDFSEDMISHADRSGAWVTVRHAGTQFRRALLIKVPLKGNVEGGDALGFEFPVEQKQFPVRPQQFPFIAPKIPD
jgi:hypothetical protein